MSYRSRNYVKGDVQYRGVVRTTGEHMTYEAVNDETEEEFAARCEAAGGRHMLDWPDHWRKRHQEERGLKPYETERVFGPYATVGPARAAAGTGAGKSKKVETGTHKDGGDYTTVRTVEIGRVAWTPLDAE